MGKGCSKDANQKVQDDIAIMDGTDYKARLEQKIYLSKENPDPIFDVSDCNLEKIPFTFAFLKVLRKEFLILAKNRLKSLASGGDLHELELLRVLDISHNRFKVIPLEICHLKNLRELFLSHNNLSRLPAVMNRLHLLELLDISHNDLVDIRSVSFMSNLKILNISSNPKLEILPPEIATNESLCDLVFDIDNIKSPSSDVLATGTQNILQYLSTGELTAPSDYAIEDAFLQQQSKKITSSRIIDETSLASSAKNFLQKEKHIQQLDSMNTDIDELHKEQQKRKEEMLRALLVQQKEAEDAVNKVHLEKDAERRKLIDDIRLYEESSSIVVNQLLELKKGPDSELLELEEKARDSLLEKVHLEQSELRKKDVIAAMSSLLENELELIQNYNEERSKTSKVLIENENVNNLLLNDVFEEYDKNRTQLIDKINQDEEWQKSAVATLIAKTDARSWGIMEQIKIVEAQISSMTNYEIDRKKANQEELLNDVAEKRANLTFVLLDLMEQQEKRKGQLLQTLADMENQRTEDDFWLMQYQKLLDQRGVLQNAQATIDPLLGYYFLLNGVVHVVPFLLKIWNKKDFCLENVSDGDLEQAGIKNKQNRIGVLKSISDFLLESSRNEINTSDFKKNAIESSEEVQEPTAPQDPLTKSPTLSASSRSENTTNNVECVVCMDNPTRVIFLPCGHLCCCIDCSSDLVQCPMCRCAIERKIKVIQP